MDNKAHLEEKFADNGEFSHYNVVCSDTGVILMDGELYKELSTIIKEAHEAVHYPLIKSILSKGL
jgi:hypothetical protein